MKLSRRIVFSARVGFTFYFSMAAVARANPTDGVVAAGAASIEAAGSALNITTATDRTIINWNSFSISSGQVTNFIQPDVSSAVLNRVIGSMPSEIAGQLLSNGRVALLNENGIFITQSGSINTNGFTASTLNLSDAQFMGNGGLTFKGDSEAVVSNAGTILARQGDVFLIGKTVSNSGHIEARDGNVALAAGSEIILQKAGDGRMSVTIPAGSKKGSVNHSGTIKAVQQQLRDNGGNPYVLGMNVDRSGEMTAADFANAQVIVDAGQGKAEVAGSIQAGSQAAGGEIQVSGAEVVVKSGAKLDVSGDFGAGTIKVGGGYQGNDGTVANARSTWVEAGATFTADTRVAGDGGDVVVWSDQATRFAGSISAKGGSLSGNGGLVEVSGKNYLAFRGEVSTLAANGRAGTLLLDPTNLTIQLASSDLNGDGTTGDDVAGDIAAGAPGVNSVITSGALSGLLLGTSISLAATNDITVADAVSWDSPNSLTLTAGNQIITNFALTNAGSGDIVLSGAGGILLNADIVTGGNLSLTSVNNAITQTAGMIKVTGISNIDAGTGAITLAQTGNDFQGAVNLTGGVVHIVDANALTLGVLKTGNLTVEANQDGASTGTLNLGSGKVDGTLNAFSNKGAITQTGGLTVTGTSNLNAVTGDITLTQITNDFQDAVTLAGGAVRIADANALTLGVLNTDNLTAEANMVGGSTGTLNLGSGTVNGMLDAFSHNGLITQTGGLTVLGASSFDAATGDIKLDLPTNDFGPLTFNGSIVLFREDFATEIVGTNTAMSLVVTASGAITDAAGTTIGVTGLATLDAGANAITLGDNALDTTNFGSLNLTGTAVAITADSATELTGVTATSLSLTASGAITDAVGTTIGVTGLATLDAGANAITLGDNALDTTNFGSLNLTGTAVAITADSATELTGVTATSLA
ncbi:MAG: filamentous hemagglutinin N-terminal domain-containing protein, partial [Verrucomicrobia bacterium]|nr:filamentous hemagglutinin N-terminal domain-containing protein [Verrucomicrobiota bacterium]